jgi:hypothetical protein
VSVLDGATAERGAVAEDWQVTGVQGSAIDGRYWNTSVSFLLNCHFFRDEQRS